MGNDHNKARQVGAAEIPTREAVTRMQLEMLQTVINTLNPFILGESRRSFFMMEEEQTPRKIDGGAAASAVVTFNNICERIDAILADQSRWDTSAHDKLYNSIAAVQKAQVEYLTAQAEGQKVLARPSVQFHPTVANDGSQFICFYGDINKPGYAVIGVGNTPAEAMESFDRAFSKTPQEQIIMAADARAEAVSQKTKRKPKTEPPSGSLI